MYNDARIGENFMKKRELPTKDEILFAISEEPLGRGEEAKVYKVHTNPDYTVRVSNEVKDYESLAQKIFNEGFKPQKDIFEGRNYAQPVAYLKGDAEDSNKVLATINLYAPGFSMEIHKPGRKVPSSEEAMMKTIALSKAVLNMPDAAIDRLYDDLHFLSSREYSIDVGSGGWFAHMGNILYSGVDKEFSIIDVQPFLKDTFKAPKGQTKGFNTPLFLTHGLVPGAHKYLAEHSKYPPIIEYRTEIVDRVIQGAERNHLNDLGGYLKSDMSELAYIWNYQLSIINIDEKYRENFVKRICSVKQEHRYRLVRHDELSLRVSGRSFHS